MRVIFSFALLFLLMFQSCDLGNSYDRIDYSYRLEDLPKIPDVPVQRSIGASPDLSGFKPDTLGKKNLIFILADDVGLGDLACYGNRLMKTPHLDRLADEGLQLNNFYAAAAQCSPSRAAILTGRFPSSLHYLRHFWDTNFDYMADTLYTMAEHFSNNGYFSAHVGKWHLGGLMPNDLKLRAKGDSTTPGPRDHGFDYYFGGFEDQRVHWKLARKNAYYRESWRYSIRNDSLAKLDSAHLSEMKTNEAISLMKKCQEKDVPFFINLWYDLAHTPYEPIGGEMEDYYREQGINPDYVNAKVMISKLDEEIGKLMSFLDESGLAENTIVVFTSDNGAAYGGSSLDLRGGKASLFEGGIRVPFIIRGLRDNKKVKEQKYPLHFVDLLPSFSKLFDLKGLDTTKAHGRNMFDQRENMIRYRRLYFRMNPDYYVGPHDSNPKTATTGAIIRNGFKLLINKHSAVALYNILEDPREQRNLLKERAILVEDLQYEYLKFEVIWRMRRLRRGPSKNRN